MDPVTIKFIQLLVAEGLGTALCVLGVFMFFRGASGKSTFLIEGAGVKAKLTNTAPGGIIALIGLVGEPDALYEYAEEVRTVHAVYAQHRIAWYGLERRRADRSFWQRRLT